MPSMKWLSPTGSSKRKFQPETRCSNSCRLRFRMSSARRDGIGCLEENGFYLLREGGKHAIYTNGTNVIPVKRHKQFDRITANEICKQAGLATRF
ncbi:MAG: type II toxin-antitoxin system HicA family toxin [Desulfobacterales bacterium]